MNRILKVVAFFVLPMIVSACGSSRPEIYTEKHQLKTLRAEVSVCSSHYNQRNVAPAYQAVWNRLEDISSLMSVVGDKSEIVKINNAGGQIVEISEDTYTVIKEGLVVSNLTQGAFDSTVRPLTQLWDQLKAENRLPTEEEQNVMKEIVGYQNIQLMNGHRVRLLDKRSALDLEGLAMGYAIDEIVEVLNKHGFYNVYVDLGGDIYTGGTTCGGGPWRVAIKDSIEKDKVLDVLYLSDTAVVTAGHYEKFFKINQSRYSDILDPRTGRPQERVISATVFSPTAILAHALATAISVLGPEEGLKLIDSLGRGYAATMMTQSPYGGTDVVNSRRYDDFHAVYKPQPPATKKK